MTAHNNQYNNQHQVMHDPVAAAFDRPIHQQMMHSNNQMMNGSNNGQHHVSQNSMQQLNSHQHNHQYNNYNNQQHSLTQHHNYNNSSHHHNLNSHNVNSISRGSNYGNQMMGSNGHHSVIASNHSDASTVYRGLHKPMIPPPPEPERVLNILRFKAIFVDNLKPNIDVQSLMMIFGTYGPIISVDIKPALGLTATFAVVEFMDHEAPQKVVTDFLSSPDGLKGKSEIMFDLKSPLVVKFTPSLDQRRDLSSGVIARNWAKKMIDRSGECFEWRFSSSCSVGRNCCRKHVVKHRGIDTLKSFSI